MRYENKKLVLDILMRELENELQHDNSSMECYELISAITDFTKSYIKGISALSYNVELKTLLEEYHYNN